MFAIVDVFCKVHARASLVVVKMYTNKLALICQCKLRVASLTTVYYINNAVLHILYIQILIRKCPAAAAVTENNYSCGHIN